MLLFDIPRGTTLESLVLSVAPAAHQKLVPASAGTDTLVCGVHFVGPGAQSFTLDIKGSTMRARKESTTAVDVWLATRAETAQIFLDDVMADGRYLPKFAPPAGVKLMSDPRAFRSFKLAQGKVELALTDFAGGRASLWVCVGPGARKPVVLEDPDVTIETNSRTYERMLAGNLPPDEALSSGDVTIRGKRFVAMQFALAMVPLYPKKK